MQNPMIPKRAAGGGGGNPLASLLGSRPGGGPAGPPGAAPGRGMSPPTVPPMPPSDDMSPGSGVGDRIRTKLDTAVDEAASYFDENYDIATDAGIAAFESYLDNPADVLTDLARILDSAGGPVSGLKADGYLRGSSSMSEERGVSPISDMPSKLGPKPPMGRPAAPMGAGGGMRPPRGAGIGGLV